METLRNMTPAQAKKIAATALADAGLEYSKLRAKTRSFGGLGFGAAVFVRPVGLAMPDARIADAKAALKGTGVILDVPKIVAPGYIVE